MHNLDVCAADVGNAFLCGKTKEKVMIKAGPEFGKDAGKTLITDKGLGPSTTNNSFVQIETS